MVDGRHGTRRAVKEGQAWLVRRADADAATSPPRIKNTKPRQSRAVSMTTGVSKATKQNRKVSAAAKKIANTAHIDEPPPLPTKDISAARCPGPDFQNVPNNNVTVGTSEIGAANIEAESLTTQAKSASPVPEHLSAAEVESIRARAKDELAAARISPGRHDFAPKQTSTSLVLPKPVHREPSPPGIAPVSPYLRALGRTPSPQPPPRLVSIPAVPPLERENMFQSLDAPAPPPNPTRQDSVNTDQDDFASLFEEDLSSYYAALPAAPSVSTAPRPSPPAPAPAPTRPTLALPKLSPPSAATVYAPTVLGVTKANTYNNLPGLGTNIPPSWNFSSLNSSTSKIGPSPTDPAFEPADLAHNDTDPTEDPAEAKDDRSHIAIDGHSEQDSMAIAWGDEDEVEDHIPIASVTNNKSKDDAAQPPPTIIDETAEIVNKPGPPEPPGSLHSGKDGNIDQEREHDDCGSPIIYSDEDDDEVNNDHHQHSDPKPRATAASTTAVESITDRI